jgi:beta-lactamase regulating signal transducer with metallopeptidase domain
LHYSTLAEILLGIWLVATPPVAKKFLEISRWMTLRKKKNAPSTEVSKNWETNELNGGFSWIFQQAM